MMLLDTTHLGPPGQNRDFPSSSVKYTQHPREKGIQPCSLHGLLSWRMLAVSEVAGRCSQRSRRILHKKWEGKWAEIHSLLCKHTAGVTAASGSHPNGTNHKTHVETFPLEETTP